MVYHVCTFIFLYLTPSSAAHFLNFNYAKVCTKKLLEIAKFVCAPQAINLQLCCTIFNFWLQNLCLCFKAFRILVTEFIIALLACKILVAEFALAL